MASSISEKLVRLERVNARFIDTLDELSASERSAKPSPERWSPVEIAEHVYKSERRSLQGISRRLDEQSERLDVGKPSRVRIAGLIVALRSPMKFTVPDNAAGVAPTGLPYDQMRGDWIGFPERWEAIAEALPPEMARVGLIRHPVAGPLTLSQTLRFLIAHAERHFDQLERTLTPERV